MSDDGADALDFLAWVETGIRFGAPASPPPAPPLPAVPFTGDIAPYWRAALDDETAAVAAAPEGSRNDRLNTAAYKLAGVVRSGHLPRGAVIAALEAAGAACGLPAGEVAATIRSAFSGAEAKGVTREKPPGDLVPPAHVLDDLPPTAADVDESDLPPVATLEELEAGFWDSRPYLRLVFDASLSRMASPWAVLGCCVARVIALVPPSITLPPIIGSRGSLNWFAAISAKSGGGKGAAMAVAKNLMPQDVLVRSIGSGEGMIETYQRAGADKDDGPPPVTSVLFSIEEIDSLGAMGGRSGQTTMAILRQGFSGEKLGYSYRGRQNEAVPEHTYRMTVVASVQPERAGVLFEDAGGGTPQRFMWFPGRDKRITADPPAWPKDHHGGDRVLPWLSDHDLTAAHGNISVPETAVRTIRQARAWSMSGDDDALDSHALFCREKFAYALALLDGRTHIDEEDWRLSGIAAAVSDWCRSKAQAGYAHGRHRQSRERGEMRAVENDERVIVEQTISRRRTERLVLRMVKYLTEHGAGTEGALQRHLAHRDRPFFQAALLAAAEGGFIVKREDGRWGLP